MCVRNKLYNNIAAHDNRCAPAVFNIVHSIRINITGEQNSKSHQYGYAGPMPAPPRTRWRVSKLQSNFRAYRIYTSKFKHFRFMIRIQKIYSKRQAGSGEGRRGHLQHGGLRPRRGAPRAMPAGCCGPLCAMKSCRYAMRSCSCSTTSLQFIPVLAETA